MILIGSKALKARNALPRWRGGKVSDTDYIGTRQEFTMILDYLRRLGDLDHWNESKKYTGKYKIKTLRSGFIEFDATDNRSNNLFDNLEDNITTEFFGLKIIIPSLKTLYLIKRSHVNYPVNWHKNYKDLISLASEIDLPRKQQWDRHFSEQQLALYEALRTESKERYSHMQDKIKLKATEEEFFNRSKSFRKYVHDDIHKAICFYENPMFERFKKDKDSPLLSQDLFEDARLSDWPKHCLFQEEAMVVGIERFYLPDRKLAADKVYRAGAAKLLHTMSKGWFQDFGLDHIHMLQKPNWNFLERFEEALSKGEIREQ